MGFKEFVARSPLTGALLFQGALIPVALILALLFGLTPWNDFHFSGRAVLTAVLATLPLLVLAWWLSYLKYHWVTDVEEKVRAVIGAIFQGRGQAAVASVALLAGVGEELLFRGVIQAGLEQVLGAAPGLLLASLLFGLVHFITPAYFVIATIMGLYLGLLYQITGNLLIACLVHALYDWMASAYYLRTNRPGG